MIQSPPVAPVPMLFTYTQPTGDVDVTDAVLSAWTQGRPFQIYGIFGHNTDNNGLENGVVFPEGTGQNALEVVYVP
jgi:hypothetical protein